MIRGTTPTIYFRFTKVNAAEISVIYLTVQDESKHTIFEKTHEDGYVDTENNMYCWDLSQEDTLALPKTVNIQTRYKVGNKAMASRVYYGVPVEEILKEGKI